MLSNPLVLNIYVIQNMSKLNKVLYGLIQAPRAWYECLSEILISEGFERGKVDRALFLKSYGDDTLIVQIYVYDIVSSANNELLCQEFSKMMKSEF